MIRLFQRRGRQRGQSLVEFTLILPILMTLTLSIAEFGVAFGTDMTLIQATREAARVGAVLVDGSKSLGCAGASGDASVDPQIIAAVQRSVESTGSGININNIDKIRIYKSNATGGEGIYNEWKRGNGPTICGVKLDFIANGAGAWPAKVRSNTLPVESLGVSIYYHHKLFTPISAVSGLVGLNEIYMIDSTVMALEP